MNEKIGIQVLTGNYFNKNYPDEVSISDPNKDINNLNVSIIDNKLQITWDDCIDSNWKRNIITKTKNYIPQTIYDAEEILTTNLQKNQYSIQPLIDGNIDVDKIYCYRIFTEFANSDEFYSGANNIVFVYTSMLIVANSVNEDPDHRFVTDVQISDWNNIKLEVIQSRGDYSNLNNRFISNEDVLNDIKNKLLIEETNINNVNQNYITLNNKLTTDENNLNTINQNYLDLNNKLLINENNLNIINEKCADFDNKLILTNQKIDDIINPLTISLNINPFIVEIGSIINSVNISWDYNKEPASQKLDNNDLDINIRNFVYSQNILLNKSFSLTAKTYGNNIITKTVTLLFANSICYGVSISTNYDSNLINSLTKKLSDNKSLTITVDSGENEYIYYALPSRLGKCNFSVGGFSGGFGLMATISFTNNSSYTENYDIYRSDNTNLGTTTVVIS